MKKTMLKIACIFLFMTGMYAKVHAETWYVGSVWGARASYQTLQELISAKSTTGLPASDEIWLGAGVHELNAAWEIIKWQSKLYGGFAGSETSVDQRIKGASGLPWDYVNKSTIKLAATVSETARKSLLFNSMSGGQQATLPLVDGITFDGTGCTASVIFYRAFSNAVTIRNCVIENGDMDVSNTLSSGTNDCIAGGISVGSDDAVPTGSINIEGCLIQNNKGRVGGIFARRTNIIVNSVIRNNEAKTSTVGSYAAGQGGGVYVVEATTLFGCILQGNKSVGDGGAVFQNAATVVANSVFYNNLKGAVSNNVYANGKSLTFVNNVIDELPAGATESNNLVQADITTLFSETEWWTQATNFPGRDGGTTTGLSNIPATDIVGNPRIINIIDIGPYEVNFCTVSRTSNASIIIDEARSSADGVYQFGDEYKVYFTVTTGTPAAEITGSTEYSIDPEAGVTNGYILTVTIGGNTTINLVAGMSRYITPAFDPDVTVVSSSVNLQSGKYAVIDGAAFNLQFAVPEGKEATVNAGGTTLSPTVTNDTVYTVTIDPVTSDFTLTITVAQATLPGAVKVTTADVNWASFLAQHDMYWTGLNTDYFSGVIMGNGLIGTNLYKANDDVFRLNVGRIDVTEGRIQHPVLGYGEHSHLYDEARLPIGSFRLTPKGVVSADTTRLSLYDAVTRGIIKTGKGRIDYRTYVHAEKNYIVFDAVTDEGEAFYKWEFVPDQAVSPRHKLGSTYAASGDNQPYADNPNPAVKNNITDGDYKLCIQPLFTGWAYVVAWKEVQQGSARRVIATVSYESSEAAAIAAAKQTLDEAFATDETAMMTAHTNWWHNYYPSSFISFDNANKMESFYWAQAYKFACASREGKPIVDIMGPWPVVTTPWPAIWMNLNTQLTYSWLAAANRPELSKPLWKAFKDNKANLIWNAQATGTLTYSDGSTKALDTENNNEVIGMARSSHYGMKTLLNPALAANNQYEVANMTWLLFYYWQYCTYNNKTDELQGDFFELLTYAINYYFEIRKTLADGKYHLPVTASPEYASGSIGADVNYDLSSLRWGLQTLIDVNDKYNLNSPKRADWQDFLDNLVGYSTGANGYKISASQEYATSHRHWSHLLQIYPYYLVNWDNPADRSIITQSVDYWQSKTGALQGYSYSGSAAMYASMGDGQRAFSQLDKLVGNESYIRPNTLYRESGNPVFETPMSANAVLHDMYLQSWGGKIRVFHATPDAWKNASFVNLRTEGAFLVSATRNNGKTVFIQVESEAGGVCRLQTGLDLSKIVVRDLNGNAVPYTTADAAAGLIEITMSQGDVIQVLNTAGTVKYPAPVEQLPSNTMKFGVNNGPASADWNWQLPAPLAVVENSSIKYVGTTAQWATKPVSLVYATVADAYAAADAGDQVWVATGTYTVGITVRNDVNIYGGFAGTENALEDRAKVSGGKSWEFVNPTVFTTTSAAVITGIAGNNGMTIDGITFDGENTAAAVRVFQFSNGVTGANYVISNCVIKNFVSNIASGGELINLRNKTEMHHCLITNNKTTASGAIVYLDYSCWMHDCEVTNNTAAGNLLSVNYTSGSGDCYNMYVANNTAGGTAGINAHGANVYNCVVVNNTSTAGSGGMAIDGRKAAGVFNNTIAGNTGATTGGLAFYTNASASVASAAANNILWNNKKGGAVHNFVRLKDIAANVNNNILDRTDYADIIFSDCVIATDSAAIFAAGWVTVETSPAWNAGTVDIAGTMPETDIAGNTRLKGTNVDIGPYENQNDAPYVNPNIALFDQMMEKIRNEKESAIDVNELVTTVNGYTYNLSGVCNVAAGGNGFFPDVDYSDTQGNAYNWKSQQHLVRILNMAYAYTMDGSSLKDDQNLFAAIEAGIRAWANTHPASCSNWWYNQIAEPRALGLILIQMRKGTLQLDETLTELPVLTRMYDRSKSGYPGTGNATSSANIIDVAEHGIYSGLLSYDAGRVRTMFDSFIYPNVKISTGVTADGIKPDQSHIMHDRVLYIGGYGEVFITGITYFTTFTAGTPYAMPEDKAEILSNFVRNTWAKAIRGRYMLWDVTGRGVSRIAELDKRGAAVYLERMKTIDPANVSEYDEAIKRLKEEEPASYGITPLSRQHFIADHTLHIRPEYTFDVNFVSTRTRRIEWGNGENKKALYMSDGCTNIARRGDEYATIFGVWNWARIPGVTCLQTPSQATINSGSTTSVTGTSTFAGGVTDSLYSVTAYSYPNGRVNLSAKKGWFMFDDEIVCLGNSITAATGSSYDPYDANTTLNQSNLNGDVAVSDDGSAYTTLATGEHSYAAAPKWVLHDSIGYIFPQGGKVVVSNQSQSGNWYDINNNGVDATVSKNVFSLWFDHGKQVTNGEYAYIIVPGKTVAEMQSYYASDNIEILANNDSVQAVRHKGLGMYGIIFYNAASYSDERISVETDKGCVLLLKDKGDYYQMNVADPAQAETQINVKTKFPASATEWTNTLCNFAGTGDYRGASKTYTVQKQTVSYEVNVNLGEGIVSVTPASATVVSGSEFTATFVVEENYENPFVTGGTAEITGNTLRIASVTENITLTLSATIKTGIDLLNLSYVNVFPNPVKAGKKFIISLGDKFTDATVGIYSVTGVKLDEKKANGNFVEQVINHRGMYIVTVKKNAETYTFKVIVE
jgi:chondroitin AC lyase